MKNKFLGVISPKYNAEIEALAIELGCSKTRLWDLITDVLRPHIDVRTVIDTLRRSFQQERLRIERFPDKNLPLHINKHFKFPSNKTFFEKRLKE